MKVFENFGDGKGLGRNTVFWKRAFDRKRQDRTSLVLVLCVLFLTLFGIVMVYSASFYAAEKNYGNAYYFLIKQIIGFVLGIFGLVFFAKFDYAKLKKYNIIFFIFCIVLLILVFVPGIGIENYGAKRWIKLPGFTLQPSELGKFGFVLFASCYMAKNYDRVKSFLGILPVIIAGGILCGLIILEPNMSITMCVGIVMFVMLFVGGLSKKHFFVLLIPALCLVPILILIEPYRLSRLMAFLNPWANPKGEGYQLIQSFFAIGNGGLFGVGLFNSRQKYLFLPFSESDFIFSVICEEFGFVGAIIVLAIYFVIVVCGIKIALKSKDRFGCYLASGITAIICVQTLLNVAVVTGMIPPTGLPLPFISAGSTSLVVFMSAVGVMMDINRQAIM